MSVTIFIFLVLVAASRLALAARRANNIGWISESGEICVDQKRFQRWISPLLEARVEELECPLGWILSHAELDESTDAMIA